jgi:hypothetical protein
MIRQQLDDLEKMFRSAGLAMGVCRDRFVLDEVRTKVMGGGG